MKYPIYIPEIKETEKAYVSDCLDSTWISSRGKYIGQFEELIANYVGTKHAISVHNGTVALHIALLAHSIGPGDEVIVPDFTYIATANAVLYNRATPVLVDVDEHSWNITPDNIEGAITPKTKAIIVADIYGLPAEMDEVNAIADKYGLIVIEDAAESLGGLYKGRKAGSLADIATLSFFGNKTITTGEGGMVLTNNDTIAALAGKLKNQGNSETKRYFHDILGYNFRMTNIQAAIGLAQMERIDSILHRKQNIYNNYKRKLGQFVKFQKQISDVTSSNWMIGFLLNNKVQRDGLMQFLEQFEIETRPFFYPIHAMPFYPDADNRVAKQLSERGISVPSYPMLSKEDVDYICEKIIAYLS